MKGPGEGSETEEPEPEPRGPVNPFYQVYRYYSSDKKSKPTTEVMEKLNNKFRKRMDKVKEMVNKLNKPDGSIDYPARTCRDLFAFHPRFKSGMWHFRRKMG